MAFASVLLVVATALYAQNGDRDSIPPDAPRLTVRLAPADNPDVPVHERETLTEVMSVDMFTGDPRDRSAAPEPPRPLGHRATLWVRGAHVNDAFTFERYYQGKFIDRGGELSIPLDELGVGEHVIGPGGHRFSIDGNGAITSADPEIAIGDGIVTLAVHGIDIMAVRGGEAGPLDQRLVPERFGLFLPPDPDNPESARVNLLSHAREFYPLRVYLPANTQGDGYRLEPYGQTFHVHPGGRVELTGDRLPGMLADGSRLVAEYAGFQARVATETGLGAGIGAASVPRSDTPRQVVVRPSRRPLLFTAGFGSPATTFGLRIDPDMMLRPRKYFLADNRGANPRDVRLLGLEWDDDVIEAGEQTTVLLRFIENTYEFSPDDFVDEYSIEGEEQPVHGIDGINRILQKHDPEGRPESHPLSVLQRYMPPEPADGATPRGDLAAFMKNAPLQALNTALHDIEFYQEEGFDGIALSDAAREAITRGIANLPRNERLPANRALLSDLFPGLIRPFDRAPSIRQPVIHAAWARYHAGNPAKRVWNAFDIDSWQREEGNLTFTMPDLPAGFYAVRFGIRDAAGEVDEPDLFVEMFSAVLRPGQRGTAAFVTPKARDAFVAGETVRIEAVIRCADDGRAPGRPTIVLRHPDGREERMPFADRGGAWSSQPFVLDGETTRHLAAGRYELTFADLPGGIYAWPLIFDLAGVDPRSPYTIVRPSKYDGPMNALVASWLGGYPGGHDDPIDLDRAVETIANQGYNRIELMTYTGNHHRRAFTEREQLAARDWRLPPPEAVFQPTPRDRLLNACVRQGIRFADVWLSHNDHHVPWYIEPYIKGSERWIQREASAMRHSPAFDGIILYDEMYEWGLIGVPDWHTELWPRLRDQKAAEHFGERPAAIRNRWGREMRRPRRDRDREALERYLELRRFMIGGWGDFNSRTARAAREVAPHARISTYNSTFFYMAGGMGAVASGIDMDCGFRPDVFRDLDIRGSIHYLDGPLGAFVHSPMKVQVLRFAPHAPTWINVLLHPEWTYSHGDGQYQRRMTFGMLAEGADGISLSGLMHSFSDEPNPSMMRGRETTAHLNRQVLEPFGELVTATEPGYRTVGIVYTFNQLALSDYKKLRTANQIEEIWIACWRLGFPAVFLRECAFAKPLDGFDVIFVPGIRFDGELDNNTMQRLRDAIARGARVVVERNSALDIDGIVRLYFDFNNYFLGPGYMPCHLEDELYRVYRYTQPTVDFLAGRLPQWTEPAAAGPFTVGPNWRSGGDIHYLVMGNYEHVDYAMSAKQFMARPARLPLTIAAARGNVAYDLLHGVELPLEPVDDGRQRVTVDMTRIQGAMVAFLPEAVGGLQAAVEPAAAGGIVRVSATLTGASGNLIDGVFPARISLSADGFEEHRYYRALGHGRSVDLRLPGGAAATAWQVAVREGFTGRTAVQSVERPAVTGAALRQLTHNRAHVPHPDEVREFLQKYDAVTLVVSELIEGVDGVADAFAAALEQRGIQVTRRNERDIIRYPGAEMGGPRPPDDGYHTWSFHGVSAIKPLTIVDAPLVLLSSAGGSRLLHALEDSGYLSVPSIGNAGLPVQPTVQVSRRALNVDYDVLGLIANDAATMQVAVDAVLAGDDGMTAPADPVIGFAAARTATDTAMAPIDPPAEHVGNNEMVTDIRFDAEGNSYVATWGHGDNLYSLDPSGAVRFSHYLPEIGPWNMKIGDDRVVVYTTSGARLYQIGLDGTPIWQLRLAMTAGMGDEPRRYFVTYEYAPATRLVVYRDDMNHAMRIIDEHGNLAAHWRGAEYEDIEDVVSRRGLHDFAVSSDGRRLAQIESTRYFGQIESDARGYAYDSYLVVRDMTGRKLHERFIDNEPRKVSARVQWDSGHDGPSLVHEGAMIRLNAELTEEIDRRDLPATGEFDFGERGTLQRVDSRTLRWADRDGHELVKLDPFPIFPTVAALSPDGSRFFFLDEYGGASLYDAATGKREHTFTVPELGNVARFSPDGNRILLGGFRRSVMGFDLQGNLVWQTGLHEHNQSIATLPIQDRVVGYPTQTTPVTDVFPDRTEKQWPSLVDEPGQLDKLVTLDENRLINGDAAGEAGWSSDASEIYATPGFTGARGILVGTQMVAQTVSGYIGDHFTWVLEFHYRRRNTGLPDAQGTAGEPPARLSAGLRAHSRHPSSVVRQFDADDKWRFARIVNKSGRDAESLSVGFRCADGEVLVDNVSLRRIRFPSVNHMLYEPVHEIAPRVLTTPRFIETYDPLGRLREAIPNRIIIQNLHSISFNLVEAGFLQNARLNDVGSDWYLYPLGAEADVHPYRRGTDIGLGLREPRWVSMVGVYFNAYDEANITPHYDILVSDINTRETHLVAEVRNNRQLFQLSTFAPRLADEVIVRLVNARMHERTVTEIEVYGPLSGREGPATFVDADGHNTYMGNFTRVDRRQPVLGRNFQGDGRGNPFTQIASHRFPIWQYPGTQALLGEDRVHVGRAIGYVQSHALAEDVHAGVARANALGFGNVGALYGGLWLLPGNDGALYGIDPVSSRTLWSVPLGKRLRSGPVAIGNDVLAASDTGRLVAIDLGSGALLRERALSAGVTGSLATDDRDIVLIADDGYLKCINATTFETRWRVPVAGWTESTPAIADGVVYSADRSGVVRAVRMTDGELLWSTALHEEFTRCPVVADDLLYLGFRRGKLAAIERGDGSIRWKIRVNSRFSYEPLPVRLAFHEPEESGRLSAATALLVFDQRVAMLVDAADGSMRRWTVRVHDRNRVEEVELALPDLPLASIAHYRGALYAVINSTNAGHRDLQFGGPLFQWNTGGVLCLTPLQTK